MIREVKSVDMVNSNRVFCEVANKIYAMLRSVTIRDFQKAPKRQYLLMLYNDTVWLLLHLNGMARYDYILSYYTYLIAMTAAPQINTNPIIATIRTMCGNDFGTSTNTSTVHCNTPH